MAFVLLGQFKPLMQLLLKSAVANLLQDVGVASLVDFECFAAVGADDFVNGGASFYFLLPPTRSLGQASALGKSSQAPFLDLCKTNLFGIELS